MIRDCGGHFVDWIGRPALMYTCFDGLCLSQCVSRMLAHAGFLEAGLCDRRANEGNSVWSFAAQGIAQGGWSCERRGGMSKGSSSGS